MFGRLSSLLSDPRAFLIDLLLSLPAILLGLTLHEAAHAYAAYRLGDPTAKMMGRLSLNPLAHLDPVGTLALVFIGFGWARPVPVNPRYYKRPRRDDLIVSIAGIVTNLAVMLIALAVLYAALPLWLRGPGADIDPRAIYQMPYAIPSMVSAYRSASISTYLLAILVNIAATNLVLGAFNLIPLPPLDGYHVFNDLILNRSSLFASRNAQMISQLVLMALLISGKTGEALSFVVVHVFGTLGNGAYAILHALGAI
ncbi:MAG: site-2 protease family protein [Clostridiales bacterium]|nr:site-2 protease family protein [Clostridiales bacterium]